MIHARRPFRLEIFADPPSLDRLQYLSDPWVLAYPVLAVAGDFDVARIDGEWLITNFVGATTVLEV